MASLARRGRKTHSPNPNTVMPTFEPLESRLMLSTVVSQPLSFSAPSAPIWTGGIAFDKSITLWDFDEGPWTLWGYGITSIGSSFGARVYANTGTVSSSLSGQLMLTCPDSVLPGQQDVPVTIQFLPDSGGSMTGELGAGLDIPLQFDMAWQLPSPLPDGSFDFTRNLEDYAGLLGISIPSNIALNTNGNFTPMLGAQVSVSGITDVADAAFNLLSLAGLIPPPVGTVAKVVSAVFYVNLGMDVHLKRTDCFTPTSLGGNLYVNGANSGSFSLSSSSSSTVYVDIPNTGSSSITLDIGDLVLSNTFHTDFSLLSGPLFEAKIDIPFIGGWTAYRHEWADLEFPLISLPNKPMAFSITDPPPIGIPVVRPEVAVSGNGQNIADGDSSPSTSDSTDFGSVVQGGAAISRTFRVSNSGGATLTTSGLTVPSGFAVTDGLAGSIPPGGYDDITIQLPTGTLGTFAGDVYFSTNDSDENPFNFGIAGAVGIEIGDGLLRTVAYTDADGTLVTMTVQGARARVVFTGDSLGHSSTGRSMLVGGSSIAISAVDILSGNDRGSMVIRTNRGGDGLATIGEITGNVPLRGLSARTVDLVGAGIALTGGGYISSVQLHELKNGADIDMPGTGATKGITIKAGMLHPDTDIVLGSYLKNLTAVQWMGSSLTTPWASRISIRGDGRNGLTGDFGADLTFTSADPKRGVALGKLSVAGTITDSVITADSGSVGSVTAAQWNAGSLNATWVKAVVTKGKRADRNGAGALAGHFGADVTLSGVSALKATLGSVRIAGDLLPGTCWDVQSGLVGSLKFSGTVQQSIVRSAGNIKSITVGATDGSDFGAGVAMDLLESNRHVEVGDAANIPQATIGTFTVKGLKLPKGAPIPRFFVDSCISAGVRKLNLLNWDDQGGLFAPAGGVKSVKHKDTADKTNCWVWPAPPTQLSTGPDDFVHIV